MAVYVQKCWNTTPCVITEGVGVELSKNGSTLYVVNAAGHRMSLFKMGFVEKYWVETSPNNFPAPAVAESNEASS
jgi:hypothetical protein